MSRNLFRIALDQLQPSDWSHFETLSGQFLISEFKNLRTMAHPSGDGGRDSELFSPEAQPFVAAQYSIARDWRAKIRHTLKRITAEFSSVRVLVYMSNQQIGGAADDLKQEVLDCGILLDPRDRNWFLERAFTDSIREAAAYELIDRIARPFLEGEGIIERKSSPLNSAEAKAALLYLGLQWQDDIAQKGLTKLCFDALVRAALRLTHSEYRLSRKRVHEIVEAAVPDANKEIVKVQIDSALGRLTKRYIRHWQKDDEFCLTHDEHVRITSRLADGAAEDRDFQETVEAHCVRCLDEVAESIPEDLDDLLKRVPRILEQLLLRRGEEFVSAVLTDTLHCVGLKQLADMILSDIDNNRPQSPILEHYPKIVATIIKSLLNEANGPTRNYLKRIANSYTLLTFLNHTPDVQSATRKLFSRGTVWIDTTVLLPLLAERIEEDQATWRLTEALTACATAGVEWRITSGVIQEVNAHMNNALACSKYQPGTWRGRIPFLYQKFIQTGRTPVEFRKWLSLFRGAERPEDDLSQFLNEVLGIQREDLTDASMKVGDDLRWAADRLWTAAHQERRRKAQLVDEDTMRILINNDTEMYLGVIALRQAEQVTELGYRHWLLTIDRNAWEIRDRIKAEFKDKTPPSPLMSLSFLLNTMAFGGHRSEATKDTEPTIPLILDIEMSESMPHDLIQLADDVRRENEGLPEYVIRQKVRDAIDRARRHWGCFSLNPVFDADEAEQC